MKGIIRASLLLMLAVCMFSCSRGERLVSCYEQACEQGDMSAAADARVSLLERDDEQVSAEQMARVDSATFGLTSQQLEELKQELDKRL